MLLFPHKMVFIKNEAALLCVTMQQRARAFAGTIYCTRFDIAFAVRNVSVWGALFKRILLWERGISKR